MGSKKTLYIILIIALIIFVVTLIVSRVWWQALLFSVIFLLLAGAVSTAGLVLPERLFRRGPPEKLREATNKEDFHKEMDAELTEFSAQPEATTENIHWMTEYTRVMKEVGELVYEVHQSVRSKDRGKQARAFREVIKEFPRLISQIKSIPELAIPNKQKSMKRQITGMDLYLVAATNFSKALEKGDGNLAGQAAMQINKALNRLDVMGKSSDGPNSIFG